MEHNNVEAAPVLQQEDDTIKGELFSDFEPPMLTAREISVACAIPALFFALLNALYLSDPILQVLSTFVGTLLEVEKVEVSGFELIPQPRGIAFLTIALLWGVTLWLGRPLIWSFYRSRRQGPQSRWFKWLDALIARFQPIPPGELASIAEESRELIVTQYGIEAGLIWPRLVSVVPERYSSELDRHALFLHFFLNLSISSIVFAFESLLTMVWLGRLPLAIVGIVSLALYYAFYAAAVLVMKQRWLYVQSCFDLYRMDLLKQMRMPLPGNLLEEWKLWPKVHALLSFETDLDPSEIHFETSKKDDG